MSGAARATTVRRALGSDADIVGREEELGQIAGLLDRCARGPEALLLEGDAGAGKSTLWRVGLTDGRSRSYRTLVAQPVEIETKLSFAALADLLEPALGEVLPQLPEPQRRALEVALLLEPARAPPERRAIATAFLNALRVLASIEPVLVAIDDIQWLDPPSESVVAFAARRLASEPIGFLLTRRAGQPPLAPTAIETGLPPERLRRIRVGPLSLGAHHHLLQARLGHAFPRPVVRRLIEVSGGNPFFTLELARALDAAPPEARTDRSLRVPHSLRALVRDRLTRLPADEREALLAAAALSRPTLTLLGAVTGSGNGTPPSLAGAVEAQVVELSGERVHFTHPLLGSVLYADGAPAERRSIHRRLAAAVTDPEESARHLALAADGPDAEIAARLDDAAVSARARGAPDSAADLLAQAIALTPADGAAALRRRRLAAAECCFAAGDTGRAEALLEEAVASSSSGRERADALVRLGWVRSRASGYAAGTEIFAEALAEGSDDPRVRASIYKGLVWSSHLRGDVGGAELHARQGVAIAEKLGEPSVLAEALADLAFVELLRGRSEYRATMDRALALEADDDWREIIGLARWIDALFLAWVGDLAAARIRLETLRRQAVEAGDEHALPYIVRWLARVECLAGDPTSAEAHADEAYDAAAQSGNEAERVFTLATKALVYAHLGRAEAARAATDEGLRLAGETAIVTARFEHLSIRGFVELSAGDPAAAHRFLATLPQELAAGGFGEPAVFRFDADLVEALVSLGELDGAGVRARELEASSRRLGSPWAVALADRCHGLLAAAAGDLDGALDHLDSALVAHRRMLEPLERARTLLHRGIVLRRAKRKRDARDSLQAGLAIFEELGATLWAARAREELTRISGSAPASGSGLTKSEQQIAHLVAAGRSNKQIAAELFITVRTVESNLTRVYRKLGIGSRVQLAQHLST